MNQFSRILKANPYHDENGKFTSKARAAGRVGPDLDSPDWQNASRQQIDDYMYAQHGMYVSWGGNSWAERKLETPEDELEFRASLKAVDRAVKTLPPATQQAIAIRKATVAPLELGEAHGLCYEDARVFGVSTKDVPFDARWSTITRAVVMGQERAQNATVIHELGHVLDGGNNRRIRTGLQNLPKKMGGKAEFKAWAELNISQYSTQNASEFIAESFSFYHTRYAGLSSSKKAAYPKEWVEWVEGI